MNGVLHQRPNTERLYFNRWDSWRKTLSVEECVLPVSKGLSRNTRTKEETMLKELT